MAKDVGFKIIAHMMPDLPNMGLERDLEQFREFFANPDFRRKLDGPLQRFVVYSRSVDFALFR